MYTGTLIENLLATVERVERQVVVPASFYFYDRTFTANVESPAQYVRLTTAMDPFVYAQPCWRRQ
jgi:hypothetical protein